MELVAGLQQLWGIYDGYVSDNVFNFLEGLGLKEAKYIYAAQNKDLPFVQTPTPVITFIGVYLVSVTFGLILCKDKYQSSNSTIQKRSDPIWLKILIYMHNIFLIVLSAYMSFTAVRYMIFYKYRIWGQDYSEKEPEMARIIYIFYISKLYEFFDTAIMFLKGNLNQVSFLHVYHHASISLIWWLIAYRAPGGDPWYSVMLNSLVHVIMYSYYLIAILVGKDSKRRKKYLWWGRYLTLFQMTQFVSMLAQSVYCYYYSPYEPFLMKVLFWYMITLLYLFGQFYVQKHLAGTATLRKQKAV